MTVSAIASRDDHAVVAEGQSVMLVSKCVWYNVKGPSFSMQLRSRAL